MCTSNIVQYAFIIVLAETMTKLTCQLRLIYTKGEPYEGRGGGPFINPPEEGEVNEICL